MYPNGAFVECTERSKTSYTNAKLTSGKTYYVRSRPYKVVDGKKYFGIYSKAKSIKVK